MQQINVAHIVDLEDCYLKSQTVHVTSFNAVVIFRVEYLRIGTVPVPVIHVPYRL